jgi:hypothetical protein
MGLYRSIHPLPLRIYGIVLNYLSTGTALPFTALCTSSVGCCYRQFNREADRLHEICDPSDRVL